MTTNPEMNLSPSDDLRSKIESAITDVWDHSAQIGHTTDAVMDMIEADRAPREIPASVRAALDRMCTPLDDSWIKRESYTVKTDMWCMAVIRAHIEGKPLAMPPRDDSDRDIEVPDRVRDALAAVLGDAMDCTRVWAAWAYGTMTQDDFSVIAEDDERLEEIARAVLLALRGTA